MLYLEAIGIFTLEMVDSILLASENIILNDIYVELKSNVKKSKNALTKSVVMVRTDSVSIMSHGNRRDSDIEKWHILCW